MNPIYDRPGLQSTGSKVLGVSPPIAPARLVLP